MEIILAGMPSSQFAPEREVPDLLKGTGDDLSDSAQIILVTIGNTGIGHFMHRLVYTTTKCWVLISMSCGWSPRLGALLGVHALSMHGDRDSFPEALIPVCNVTAFCTPDLTVLFTGFESKHFDSIKSCFIQCTLLTLNSALSW
jgi:hypothetical protein